MGDLLDSLKIDDGMRVPAPERRPRGSPGSRRVVLIGSALAIPAALAAWHFASARAAAVEAAPPRAAAASLPPPPPAGLAAGGYVQAARTVQVVPRVSGRIVSMSIQEGDVVSAGDVVAVLDSRDLEQDVIEAKAAMGVASATLARVRAGSRPQEIAATKARFEAAKAELESAARDAERSRELAGAGAISAQALDRAETEYQVRASALEASRQALSLSEAGPAAEDVQAAEATLAVARAKWTRATQRLGDSHVRAPIAGRVIRKLRDVGDFVSSEAPFVERADTLAVGSPLVTLADAGPQEVTADVNETDIAGISLHQDVEVTTAAFPSLALHGAVTRLAPLADRNKGTVQVRVTLQDAAAVLPQDLSVKLRFIPPRSGGSSSSRAVAKEE